MKALKILLISVICVMSVSGVAQEKAGRKDTTKHLVLYTCPTHSEAEKNDPGKCPKCGMDLVLSQKEAMKKEVTKNYTCPVHLDVVSDKKGKCPKCGKKLLLSKKEQMKAEVTKTYACTMHPDVSSDKPGKCPKCGMDLTEKKNEH
jgi:transcription initiation factor IIE alpha subunit